MGLTLPEAVFIGAAAAVVSAAVYETYQSDSLVSIYNDLTSGIANAILSWSGIIATENQEFQVSQPSLDSNAVPLLDSIQSPTQNTNAMFKALGDAVNPPFQDENASLLAYVQSAAASGSQAGGGGGTGSGGGDNGGGGMQQGPVSGTLTGTYTGTVESTLGELFTSAATATDVNSAGGQVSGTVVFAQYPDVEFGVIVSTTANVSATLSGSIQPQGQADGTLTIHLPLPTGDVQLSWTGTVTSSGITINLSYQGSSAGTITLNP